MADIVIAGNTYGAVPSIIVPKSGGGEAEFFDMDGDWSFLGKGAEIVETDFYSHIDTLDNTGFNGWTPSTTATVIVPSVTATDSKFTATDMDEYTYYMVWECSIDLVYTETPTQKTETPACILPHLFTLL